MLSAALEEARKQATDHPALTDEETGLANWLHFELVYDHLFEAGDRGVGFTVAVVICGESELPPDELRGVGQALKKVVRRADLVAHAGEGRFLILLVGTNLPGARVAADRIEPTVSAETTQPVSFGLASYGPYAGSAADLLEAAERAALTAAAAGGGIDFA